MSADDTTPSVIRVRMSSWQLAVGSPSGRSAIQEAMFRRVERVVQEYERDATGKLHLVIARCGVGLWTGIHGRGGHARNFPRGLLRGNRGKTFKCNI